MPDDVFRDLVQEADSGLDVKIGQVHELLRLLREEMAEKVSGLRREVEHAERAQQTAIDKAERAADNRFASVNEFREQLRAQTQTFALKEAQEKEFSQVRRSLDALGERIRFIEATYAQREPTDRAFRELERQLEDARRRDLPRETFESTLVSWGEWRTQVDSRINQWAGRDSEIIRGQDRGDPRTLWAWGAAVSLVTTIAIILATVVATQ